MKFVIRNAEPPAMRSSLIMRFNDDGSIDSIPMTEENADYRTYLAWVAEGNTAEEWSPEA
jgi:hypothetical protein